MKGDLKLTKNDIGCAISIKTNDGFFLEGLIKTVTDTNVEIKDLKTKNIFTIYIFEIKEFEIIRNDCERDTKSGQVNHTVPVIKKESVKYEHVVFGSLYRDERELNYCEVNEIDIEKLLEKPLEEDIYVCRYLCVNAKDFRSQEEVYKKAIRYLSMFQTIGVSVYTNEDGVENKLNCNVYKYLTISVPHLDLVIDIDKLSGSEFQRCHENLVALLTSERTLKLVNLGQHIVAGIASVLQVELRNFLDIQILHYGLHNLRMASAFKTSMSYSQLVALLFNVEYKQCKSFFTADDVARKMAFNAHFLLPIFELMSSRLLEPVKLISQRICRLRADSNWDINETLIGLDLAGSQSNQIDYDILPRASQFWSYQDNSGALQARKVIDIEMQNEKQAANLGGVRDVFEIKKNLAIAEEMTQQKVRNNYYEEISEDEDDNEAILAEKSFSPNSKWNQRSRGSPVRSEQTRASAEEILLNKPIIESPMRSPENGHAKEAEVPAVAGKIGVGRGRGVGKTHARTSNTRMESMGKSVGSSGSVQSIELTRSEDLMEDFNNCSTSTRYPRPTKINNSAVIESPSTVESIDKIFAKGRGVSCGNRRKISQSSGGGVETSWRPTATANNNDNQDNQEEYCELSARHWNRNISGGGGGGGVGGGRQGKLHLDRLPDDDNVSSTVPACNQAMGLMWNSFGMRSAQETDDLYAEFGL